MRILIAEEALHSGSGHWPNYIGCIASGLRRAGDKVDILAHRECLADLAERLQTIPHFSRNCWVDPASQGSIGGIRHNLAYRKELEDHLEQQEAPYDWVCALTMRIQHLLGLALLSRSRRIPPGTRFLLLFVQGFGVYQGRGKPVLFPRNGSTLLARLCFNLLAGSVRSGRTVLAAETREMQKELEQFTGLPVTLFPHPVPPPSGNNRMEPSSDRIVFTCPGFARHEKGSDILQEAIIQLLNRSDRANLRFVLQWPQAFRMPDGTLLGPHEMLVRDERVVLRNENLDAREYEKMLSDSDVVLLPYRKNSYHNRVSRVAIEAASRGKPFIFTEGTWSGEVAEISGAGIPMRDETPEALMEAVELVVTEIGQLKEKARENARLVAEFHSAETFRGKLLKGSVS